jgi:uncharacterized membrane protein YphA (DoxX/SURF4 family)
MIKTYLADPGFALTARWALALVFILAVIHKLKAPAGFKTTLRNYRLLPERLLTPSLYAIIALELLAVAGLLTNSRLGSGVAAILLAIYTFSISINLVRGRLDIDCGCSGPAIRQTLSVWLVVRNSGLLAAALLTLPASNPRPLSLLDWFTACAAVITFALIYFAASYLSAAKLRYGH